MEPPRCPPFPVLALEDADSPRGIHRGRPSGHRSPPGVQDTGGAWSLPTGRLSSRGYRDRKDAARLEALCFATLRVVLQAARNRSRTAEKVQGEAVQNPTRAVDANRNCTDTYQLMPAPAYTCMFERMLAHLNCPIISIKQELWSLNT
jgi:hypothetical protein